MRLASCSTVVQPGEDDKGMGDAVRHDGTSRWTATRLRLVASPRLQQKGRLEVHRICGGWTLAYPTSQKVIAGSSIRRAVDTKDLARAGQGYTAESTTR